MKTCKHFASRTHKSIASQRRIFDACSEKKINLKKIITSCKTRWNSGFMCMSSILHLKPALGAITNSDLKSDNILYHLSLHRSILKGLKKLFQFYKCLVTSQMLCPQKSIRQLIYSFQACLIFKKKIKLLILPGDSISTNFVSKTLSNLSKRFPECASSFTNTALCISLIPNLKDTYCQALGERVLLFLNSKDVC